MNKIISAILEIDGKIVHFGEADITEAPGTPEPVDPAAYGPDGWSYPDEFGCVQNKRIDELLAQLAVGDKYDREAAATAPRKFAIFIPDRTYDSVTRKNLVRNYQQHNNVLVGASLMGAMLQGDFYPNIVRDTEDQIPPFTYIYGTALEGYMTPVRGFKLYEIHKIFADTYISLLTREISGKRYYGENPNAPVPSPRAD